MKKFALLWLLSSLTAATVFAQNTFPATGNVGIGTTTPAFPLDVNGDINQSTGSVLRMAGLPVFKYVAAKKNILIGGGGVNTTGIENTAIGFHSLLDNTLGQVNTAVGWTALAANTSGQENTAIGAAALSVNSTGESNTATGTSALLENSTGDANTATGASALILNTTGSANTASGASALDNNSTGSFNTAMGSGALEISTTGNYNTACGYQALFSGFTGSFNTAGGANALNHNLTGSFNTATGDSALYSNLTGTSNTAEGEEAGFNVTSGSNNTFLGANANCGSVGKSSNMTALGSGATVTVSNHVVVGNSAVTSIGGFVNWSNLSDGRVKKNIQQNVPGLAFINKLNPITYTLDLDAADKIINRPAQKDKNGNIVQLTSDEIQSRREKEQIVYTGFVAQDVEKAAQSVDYIFSGVDKPGNENSLYGLRYGDFVVPLVKAVQELSAQNDLLKSQNENLQTRVSALEASQSAAGTTGMVHVSLDNSDNTTLLGQNIPNPFDHSTLIPFRIPSDCHDASIAIVETATGRIIHLIPVSCTETQLSFDAGSLASGDYSYSLYVDGKLVETKQMVLSK